MLKRVSGSVVLACALGWVGPAAAAQNPGRSPTDGRLERASGGLSRDARDARFRPAPASRRAALARFEAALGPVSATWDSATEVPHHLLLSGLPAPGVMADAAKAEALAKDLLSRHLDLLAPGTSASDFVLASNDLSAGIRSVGFVQTHGGATVLGGHISFRFKFDRLVMVTSGAYPDIAIPGRARTASDRSVRSRARGWVADDVPGFVTGTGAVQGPFILPLIDDAGALEYREVWRTAVEVASPSTRWTVYLDAETGEPVAREQTLLFGTGQLLLDVPLRSPESPRLQAAADLLFVTVDGVQGTTTDAGFFDFPGDAATVTTTMQGVFAEVTNDAGPEASTNLAASGELASVWFEPTQEAEAQLSAYVHTMIVKNFVRSVSSVDWLDEPIPVIVNIDDDCNAFSDGNSINFFTRGGGCENTALLADVIYHEFGHSLHSQSLLEGVGQFNVSLSEGISDYLSATITGDSGLARGFFSSDPETPLREIDPEGFEVRWPEDRGEVHDEGLIIAGALWDLRKRMIEKLGPEQGRVYTDRVWYETTRRAVDIPSMYPEALLLDDDDGNLTNGTPNACDINAAYGPHGLFNPGRGNEQVSMTAETTGPVISLELSLPNFPDCPIAAAPTVLWRERGSRDATPVAMEFVPGSISGYVAQLPAQAPGTVIELQVLPGYDIDPSRTLPDNIADPWYQLYIGEVIELGCLGADSGVILDPSWEVGPWSPDTSGSDPSEPFGTGDHLWQPGNYPPGRTVELAFGAIDTGPYPQVRLQFRRWLAVEDGFYDRAYIEVNGERLWQNFASAEDYLASFHHVDQEWRFVDFDISEFIGPDGVAITFGTRSDGGLEFGGRSLAEVCVVAVDGPISGCGNGVIEAPEACDDGNVLAADGCDASCQIEPVAPPPEETPGDTDTQGEPGGDTDPDADLLDDGLIDRGCVCTGSGSGGSEGLLLLVLLGVLRRHRKR